MWEGGIALDWQKLHVPSTECPRIPASFLESERRLLGEAIYRREYLAEFSASETGMFDPDLLQAALLPHDFVFNQGGPTMAPASARAAHDAGHAAGPAARISAIDTSISPGRR